MSKITKQDTDGVKPLLGTGELGYDNYPAGGDKGRVYVGTGTENISMAKKIEVTAVDTKINTHTAKVDNPHAVTKAQVGLGNADNTADVNKNVLSATKLTTARTIGGVSFDGTANINLPGVNTAGNQNTTGNAGTATKLATARTINGVSFDGTANIVAPTNLTVGTRTATAVPIESSTGTNASIPAATTTLAGVMSSADKVKLEGIAVGAQVNVATNLGITAGTTAGPIVTSSTGTNATLPTASASASGVVTTGNQTWVGVKEFSSSPIVPTPTENNQAVNKRYVDLMATGGSLDAYGVRFDQENDIITPLGSGNRTLIQEKMKRCVLNADGAVNYFLDQYDSTKKEGSTGAGAPSVLDGTDGNVMVQVPLFYIKHSLVGDVHEWWVSLLPKEGYSVHPWFLEGGVTHSFRYYRAYTCSVKDNKLMSISGVKPTVSQTRATFRTQARANGAGWNMCSWNAVNAIQILFLTEYCTFNSQAVLGTGNHLGNDYAMTTGASNSLGNQSSVYGLDKVMSYRGIENFYADTREFIDGMNVQNYKVYLNQNPNTFADDVFTGDYKDIGITVPAASASYVKKISGNFIPTAVGGSSSTYITDGLWSNTGNRIAFFGGSAHDGALGGAFCLRVNHAASDGGASVGAGLSR